MSVRSNVAGSRVYLDGRWIGSTGSDLHPVQPGSVALRVEADGYEPAEQRLELAAGEVRVVTVELSRVGPPTASLLVRSNVDGAQVVVDDLPARSVSAEPIVVAAETEVRVRVEKPGHDTVKRTVRLVSGEQRTLDFTLVAVPGAGCADAIASRFSGPVPDPTVVPVRIGGQRLSFFALLARCGEGDLELVLCTPDEVPSGTVFDLRSGASFSDQMGAPVSPDVASLIPIQRDRPVFVGLRGEATVRGRRFGSLEAKVPLWLESRSRADLEIRSLPAAPVCAR